MGKTQELARLVRVSDETFAMIEKAQRVRETYGDVVKRAMEILLEKEQKKK
jgi:hypothetical protein